MAVRQNLLSNGLALNLGALAAVAAYMVHSFVDFNLHIPANVLLLAFVFGLLANPGTQREAEATTPMSILRWRFILPALAAVVAIQCARLLPGEYFAERARTAQRDGHSNAAIVYTSRALTTEHKNPVLYQYLGSAQLTNCDLNSNLPERAACYAEAVKAFEKAHALAPPDRTFLIPLAFTYDALERFAEAEWIFYEARKWDPRSTSINEVYKFHLAQWRNGQALDESIETPK